VTVQVLQMMIFHSLNIHMFSVSRKQPCIR